MMGRVGAVDLLPRGVRFGDQEADSMPGREVCIYLREYAGNVP